LNALLVCATLELVATIVKTAVPPGCTNVAFTVLTRLTAGSTTLVDVWPLVLSDRPTES
jgi:hypothetical protein